MAKPKIRHYPSKQDYEEGFKAWLKDQRGIYHKMLLDKLNYESMEQLREDEYAGKFGFCCGYVNLIPKNEEMFHEWGLDNGKYGAKIHDIGFYGISSQLVILKEPIVRQMLEDMNLENEFSVEIKLD